MNVTSVAEQLLFTTARIETRSGSQAGVGTAFLFEVRGEGGPMPFLVSNRHVVENAEDGWVHFLHGDTTGPRLGQLHRVQIAGFTSYWYPHPDPNIDIAVAPFAPILEEARQQGFDLFFRTIGPDVVPSPDEISKLDVLEEVVFVGYPNGMWDEVNRLPIIRKGNTASSPAIDFGGKPTFLIDASVFPGSSGSPVLVFNQGLHATKDGGTVIGEPRLYFLGVLSGVFCHEDEGEVTIREIPAAQKPVSIYRQMIDLGDC